MASSLDHPQKYQGWERKGGWRSSDSYRYNLRAPLTYHLPISFFGRRKVKNTSKERRRKKEKKGFISAAVQRWTVLSSQDASRQSEGRKTLQASPWKSYCACWEPGGPITDPDSADSLVRQSLTEHGYLLGASSSNITASPNGRGVFRYDPTK